MFQARHKQLMHQTNVAVVNIRSIELNYFMNFFSNLGINAAVGFGLIAGSVSQVPGYDNPTGCWYGFVLLYWIASALTVVSSIFALITEIYVVVYGQGLALRGPAGSMIKAIDGMVDEQKTILWAFILTIFFLGLQQIGMYFIMMDSTSAWITSSLTVVAMFNWYRYGLRLYNRFNWKQIEIAWKEEEENQGPINDDDIDPITRLEQQLNAQKQNTNSPKSNKTNNNSMSDRNSTRPSIVPSLTKAKSTTSVAKSLRGSVADDSGSGDADNRGKQNYENNFIDETNENNAPVTGFLSIRIPRKRTIFSSFATKGKNNNNESSGDWKRRFFVIQGISIFYYQDRRAYESDPNKPLNPRPINLDGYTLIGGAQVAPYYISLIPADPEDDRKAWKFRCDTLNEFTQWLDIFTAALRKCPSWRQSDASDFIDVAAMRDDPHQAPQMPEDSDEDD